LFFKNVNAVTSTKSAMALITSEVRKLWRLLFLGLRACPAWPDWVLDDIVSDAY
jgi:hypothetical protein